MAQTKKQYLLITFPVWPVQKEMHLDSRFVPILLQDEEILIASKSPLPIRYADA